MSLHPGNLGPAKGSRRRGRYLGRGRSTGHGKTSGRGIKGQFSRTGSRRRPGFQGGDLPLYMRYGKRGFVSPFKKRYRLVNLGMLERAFAAGDTVTPASLAEKRLVAAARFPVKVLGDGALNKSLNVSAHAFSGSARAKIEAAGGSCTLLGPAGAS